jgi:transcriptional regulator with XRE-family HTH domain
MRDEVRERVASEVRAELGRQRRTQLELAEVMGVNQSTASRRLAGELEFTVGELHAIAKFFGVPITKLLPADEPEQATA